MTVLSDNFNANSTASWVNDSGVLTVDRNDSNTAQFEAGASPNVARYGTAQDNSTHYSQAQVVVRSNSYQGLTARASSVRFFALLVQGTGNETAQTFKREASTWTQLGTTAITFSSGDIWRLDCSGVGVGTVTTAKQNDSVLHTGAPSDTDFDILTGVGMTSDNSAAELDNWQSDVLDAGAPAVSVRFSLAATGAGR